MKIKKHTDNRKYKSHLSVLNPNRFLVTNCGYYFISELIGVNKKFNNLMVKRQKDMNIYRYLSYIVTQVRF